MAGELPEKSTLTKGNMTSADNSKKVYDMFLIVTVLHALKKSLINF